MLKMTARYEDYNGEQQSEDCWFHLNKPELIRFQAKLKGDLQFELDRIVQKGDMDELVSLFEELVQMAYGERSADGRRFRKSPEILQDFLDSPAYEAVFMEIFTNTEKALEFIEGVLPKDLQEDVKLEERSREIAARYGVSRPEEDASE